MSKPIDGSKKLYLDGTGRNWMGIGIDHHDVVRSVLSGDISAWITIHNDGDIAVEKISRDKDGRIIDTDDVDNGDYNMGDMPIDLSPEQLSDIAEVCKIASAQVPLWGKIDLRLSAQQVRELHENGGKINAESVWGTCDQTEHGTIELFVKKIIDGETMTLMLGNIFVITDDITPHRPQS